jgi:hypothetical protein
VVPHYLSLKELSELSGFSESTLRRRMKDGTLRPIQPGGPGTRMAFRYDVLEQLAAPAPLDSGRAHEGAHAALAESSDRRPLAHIPGPRPKWMSKSE